MLQGGKDYYRIFATCQEAWEERKWKNKGQIIISLPQHTFLIRIGTKHQSSPKLASLYKYIHTYTNSILLLVPKHE